MWKNKDYFATLRKRFPIATTRKSQNTQSKSHLVKIVKTRGVQSATGWFATGEAEKRCQRHGGKRGAHAFVHSSRLSGGILCFDGAINRRKVAVKRIESQVRSADVVKWPRAIGRTVAPGTPSRVTRTPSSGLDRRRVDAWSTFFLCHATMTWLIA